VFCYSHIYIYTIQGWSVDDWKGYDRELGRPWNLGFNSIVRFPSHMMRLGMNLYLYIYIYSHLLYADSMESQFIWMKNWLGIQASRPLTGANVGISQTFWDACDVFSSRLILVLREVWTASPNLADILSFPQRQEVSRRPTVQWTDSKTHLLWNESPWRWNQQDFQVLSITMSGVERAQ
jgi:hypothetical protein